MIEKFYLCANDWQILRSPSLSQLTVLPLTLGSLSLRHLTGLAAKVLAPLPSSC